MRTALCMSALAAALAASAPAQDQVRPITPAPDPWVISFEPAAWYAAASGDIRLPGTAGAGNGQSIPVADLNLDSPRVSPSGELQLRRGDWRLRLEGVGFSAGNRNAQPAAAGQIGSAPFIGGDTLRSSVDLHTFALEGGYSFHRYQSGTLHNGGAKLRSTLTGLVGVRAMDIDVETQVFTPGTTGTPPTAAGDAFHAHPYGGLRWEMDIHEDFTIDLIGAIGGLRLGDSESWSADIMVGFQWNPAPWFGAQIGYRQLLLGTEDGAAPGELAWNGGLAGVYAGAVLRF